MPVEIVTLAPKPVEQTGEFVGTIKSRKSTTIQPQAEGIITHISVKSGDRVSPGARHPRDRRRSAAGRRGRARRHPRGA